MLTPTNGPELTLPALFDDGTSPTLLSDTRQREGHHNNVLAAAARREFPVLPARLDVGDYRLMSPAGILSRATIDTKRGLAETQQNMTIERERVANEMSRARESGLGLLFLVELEPDEIENLGRASTLCSTCPRSGTCRHTGHCDQYDGPWDFSDPVATLTSFASFCRDGGSRAAVCSVEETGDVVLDLLTGETSRAVLVL